MNKVLKKLRNREDKHLAWLWFTRGAATARESHLREEFERLWKEEHKSQPWEVVEYK